MEKKIDCGSYKKIFIITFIFWMVAHGYRFMNNLYTSDALVSVFQDDISWQRSLGRFMQPLILVLRGTVCAPWLIMLVGIFAFSIAMFFLVKMLNLYSFFSITIVIGVLVCNVTWTSSVAAFLPWIDVYAIAMLCAVFGVWMIVQDSFKGYAVGCISLIFCMALYQAYIDVALVLIVWISIMELCDSKRPMKNEIVCIVKRIATVGVSGVFYYIAYHVVCYIHHVEIASTYNGLASVGDFSGYSVLRLISETYLSVFRKIWEQSTFASTFLMGKSVSGMWSVTIKICVMLSIVMVLFGMLYLNIKKKNSFCTLALQFVGILLVPFAINFVFLMSKGMEHELMILSFNFVFVFAIAVIDKCIAEYGGKKRMRWEIYLPFALIIWNNIVFSNQVYFKVDMQDRAALSLATRLIDDIEDVEGYIPGITPVTFIGGLEDETSLVPYLRDIQVYGVGETPFNYDTFSLRTYINVYLNSNMLISDGINVQKKMVDQMSVYPASNSILFLEDMVYVLLSK